MKVLIVNANDIVGGAARAAYRLFKGLNEFDIETYMLVANKFTDNSRIIGPKTRIHKGINLMRPAINQIPLIRYRKRDKSLFSPTFLPSIDILDTIQKTKPDIIHLHWVKP